MLYIFGVCFASCWFGVVERTPLNRAQQYCSIGFFSTDGTVFV